MDAILGKNFVTVVQTSGARRNRKSSIRSRWLLFTLMEIAGSALSNRGSTNPSIGPGDPIPLVVVLWQNTNFGGVKREFVTDIDNLKTYSFNDMTSAVGVHPGPDYEAWKLAHPNQEPTVTLFQNATGQGKALVLQTGQYPDLKIYGMNDKVSSLYFRNTQQGIISPQGTAATFSSIPFVILLTANSSPLWLVESTQNLAADYGSRYRVYQNHALVIRRTSATSQNDVEFCASGTGGQCFSITKLSGIPDPPFGTLFDATTYPSLGSVRIH